MSSSILFVFEGEKTEKQITNNLTRYFVNENINVQCAFCSDIYQLYDKIYADDDLDTFAVLKNRPQNIATLSSYKRSDFAEIYMFFDYDGHAPNACDEKLRDLLLFFDEETDTGKLFISYPMVEAIKHLSTDIVFKTLKVKAKENIGYKGKVSNECDINIRDLTAITKIQWLEIIAEHLKKMNYIVDNNYSLPTSYIPQVNIFDKQLEKYINVDSTVAVLSAFPVFIFDYYGFKKIASFLEDLKG